MIYFMQELEEKAPILQQQRRDYENALHSVDKLTRKLETALVVSTAQKYIIKHGIIITRL
jgi:hypothetical protein